MQGDGLALDEETRFINVAIALGRDIPVSQNLHRIWTITAVLRFDVTELTDSG